MSESWGCVACGQDRELLGATRVVTVNDSAENWLPKHFRPMTHVRLTQRDHIVYVIKLRRPPIV